MSDEPQVSVPAVETRPACKCGHEFADHSTAMTTGCVEFVGIKLCPCERYEPASLPAETPTPAKDFDFSVETWGAGTNRAIECPTCHGTGNVSRASSAPAETQPALQDAAGVIASLRTEADRLEETHGSTNAGDLHRAADFIEAVLRAPAETTRRTPELRLIEWSLIRFALENVSINSERKEFVADANALLEKLWPWFPTDASWQADGVPSPGRSE